jgi:hypothetical protein
MTPRDWFVLAVRLLGLYFLYHAIASLLGIIPAILATIGLAHAVGTAISFAWVVQVMLYILAALYFLRGAPGIVRFAYSESPPSPRA